MSLPHFSKRNLSPAPPSRLKNSTGPLPSKEQAANKATCLHENLPCGARNQTNNQTNTDMFAHNQIGYFGARNLPCNAWPPSPTSPSHTLPAPRAESFVNKKPLREAAAATLCTSGQAAERKHCSIALHGRPGQAGQGAC